MTGTNDQIPDERPQRRREYTGSSSTLGVAALIVVVVGVAIWWFEFRASNPSGTSAEGLGIVDLPAALNPTGEGPAGEEGRAAPNFTLLTPDGERSTLTDYRGGYVLLNFWASWCGPCRSETPALQRLTEQTEGRLTVLGVNLQEVPADIDRFVAEFELTYPMVMDKDGQVSDAYRIPVGPPSSVLIDPDGVIVRYYYGAVSDDDLADLAAEHLG